MSYFSSLLDWSHPDYPLLMSATIARIWTYLGSESVLVPALLGGFFTFAVAALLVFSLTTLQLKNQGYLAATFLLASSPFISVGSYQIADVPLGFFMLATVILLTLKGHDVSANNRLVVLAGMTCALAAWTKNEGILFVAAVLISRAALYLRRRNAGEYVREMLFFLFGFFPFMAVVLFFKIKYSPPNDLVATQMLNLAVPKLLDLSRYRIIGTWFLREITHFGNGATILFLVYLVLVRLRLNERNIQALISGSALLATMLCGYFFIYVITPYDLSLHLASSLQRLLVHLWPILLFLTFLITRPFFDREMEEGATLL